MSTRFSVITPVTRILGAIALLAAGTVHLQQYLSAGYSGIPTIGTLFMLNFLAAAVLAVVLLAPIVTTRLPLWIRRVAAIGGIFVAGGAIVALLISEHTALFGFRESGYDAAIVFALVTEALTVVLLGTYLALSRATHAPARRAHRAQTLAS